MRDRSLNPKIAPDGVIVISISAEHPYICLGRNLNDATPRVFITGSEPAIQTPDRRVTVQLSYTLRGCATVCLHPVGNVVVRPSYAPNVDAGSLLVIVEYPARNVRSMVWFASIKMIVLHHNALHLGHRVNP